MAELVEKEVGWESFAWECSECEDLRSFEYGTPEENNFHYCPNCGDRITDYIYHEYEYIYNEYEED